jgi:hypothetical protein
MCIMYQLQKLYVINGNLFILQCEYQRVALIVAWISSWHLIKNVSKVVAIFPAKLKPSHTFKHRFQIKCCFNFS